MEPMKRKVLVTVTKEIEIEIMPSMFMGLTEAEYLKEFSETFWEVNDMNDIFKFAAKTAAIHGSCEEEGLGDIEASHMKEIDIPANVYYDEMWVDIDAEFTR